MIPRWNALRSQGIPPDKEVAPHTSLFARPALVFLCANAILVAAAAAQDTVHSTEMKIINVHEHIESVAEVPKLLNVMDQLGIGKTILVGSSRFTITLDQSSGFSHYDENNEQLIDIVRRFPSRFEAWPTINPLDPDKLEKFMALVARGATGLKLYIGHGMLKKGSKEYFFHVMPIDDPRMLPVYAYCESNFIPICMHVNPGPTKPGFAQQFVSVLTRFPNLKIICPHFMLSSIHRTRLEEFLDTFPNLYTDISFGHDDYLLEGIERLAANATSIRNLIENRPTRFMFGTDCVITAAKFKDETWIAERYRTYLDALTTAEYATPLLPGKKLRGLALPHELAVQVLGQNYERFAASLPKNTVITRSIQWHRMNTAPLPPANQSPQTDPTVRSETLPNAQTQPSKL